MSRVSRPCGFVCCWLVVSLCLAAAAPAALAATPSNLSHLRALAKHAKVSALVVRLRDMHTIAELDPDQRLRPASVSKLFSASAALQAFGPAHRFTTRLASKGRLDNGTLHGNLVFVGGGDPSFDNRRMHELVMRLQARGVTRVTGNLVIDNGLWGNVPCLTADRCAAHQRASHAYSAPLSAAGIDFGTVMATVYPGAAAGDRPRVVLHPAGLPGYRIDNQVTTGKPDSQPDIAAWRTEDGGHSTLHVRGSLPAGSAPYDFQRAVINAATETGRVLATMLAGAGIHVDGRVATRSGSVHDAGQTLAAVRSATLAEQLIPMMAYSNNYMADTLTLDVAAHSGDSLPLTLPRAAQTLETLSAHANQAIYPGHDSGHGRFDSGSGLSLGNCVSARDVVALLAYMYHQNALFPAFYGSLPVPASAPSHTLKHGNFSFETRLVAKTGTLSQPVTVRALAGYFRLDDGGFAAYAILINGTEHHANLTYQQTVTAYQNDLQKILARH